MSKKDPHGPPRLVHASKSAEVPRCRYSNRRVTVVFEPPSNAQVGWLAVADVQPVFMRNGF